MARPRSPVQAPCEPRGWRRDAADEEEQPRAARHLETAGDTAHRVSHLLASPQSTFRVGFQTSGLCLEATTRYA